MLPAQAELFPDHQPLPSLPPPPLVGKPHHCTGSSHRRDSRMDPLFTQAVKGLAHEGWDVVAGHERSLLLNLELLMQAEHLMRVKYF